MPSGSHWLTVRLYTLDERLGLELDRSADRGRGGGLLDPRRTTGTGGGNTFLVAGIGAVCLTNCRKDGAGSPMLLSEEVEESGVRNGGLRRVSTAYGTDMTRETGVLNRFACRYASTLVNRDSEVDFTMSSAM